jgi:FMN phosphatase YigB (HAD superfamily)
MFWIRPSSYKEFLTHDFNYSDFPDELGQLDGTLQHALERIMGVYPSIKGLDHLVYVSEIDRFTLDTSFIWSTYTFKTGELLAEHLIPFQGISFDFFDTLYRREHQFQDIAKYNTGKHLAKATGLSAIEFVILRNQTELRMREILGKDVSLLEVTTELAKKINVDSEYLYDLECHFEYIEAMPRTEMVRMLNKLIEMNKRILIISDTYYDVDFIERLAEKIGLQKGIEYYISTDLNARKDSGSMWHLLLKNSIVDISSHVHVGDNFLSDGQIPGDLGIYTTLVMSGEAKWRRAGLPEYNITLNTLNEDPNAFVKSKLISEFGDSPF